MHLKHLILIIFISSVLFAGCAEKKPMGTSKVDERVVMADKVGNDTARNNILVRPISQLVSAIKGEGLDVQDVQTRVTDKGLLEVHVKGYNRSYNTKKFQYKFIWLDKDGFEIDTRTNVWRLNSAIGKAEFTIKSIAPTPKAVSFRFITRNKF